jgi:hypothetical protein
LAKTGKELFSQSTRILLKEAEKLMKLSIQAVRIYWYICAAFYVVWSVYRIPKLAPDEVAFAAVVFSLLFILYLFPITVFGSDIKLEEEGIKVLQYRRTFIPFSSIRACYSIFLVPFQLVLVITACKFPLRILVAGDKPIHSARRFGCAGQLADQIKAVIAK